MNIKYNLRGEIIVKAFVNSLNWEQERIEWFQRYKEHLPVFPEKIEVQMTVSEGLLMHFKHTSQLPLYSYDLIPFYQSLLNIYDKHLIFSNPNTPKTADNHGLKISQILEYLQTWKDIIPLNDYPNIRREKYNQEMRLIEQRINEYHKNNSSETKNQLLQSIT